MKSYHEWHLQQEFSALDSGMENQIDNLDVISLVKRRLEMLFEELGKRNLPRQKAIEMLALILKEFQSEFSLNTANIRSAARLAQQQPQSQEDNMPSGSGF